jgi:hypothetical protein
MFPLRLRVAVKAAALLVAAKMPAFTTHLAILIPYICHFFDRRVNFLRRALADFTQITIGLSHRLCVLLVTMRNA